MSADQLQAAVTLRHPAGRVGAERIALLDAVRRTGSISAAARELGLSYKAAWDAVQVLNNLFERPLVIPSTGGRTGGASVVTDAGAAVIEAFAAAEVELARALTRLETGLAGNLSLRPLLWGPGMRTSARNVLRGTVARVTPGAIDAEVVLTVADGVEIVATVTRDSVESLELAAGVPALALIKSSFVVLACGRDLRTSARNCLPGTVIERLDDAIASEMTLELGPGKTLTATLTRQSADALDLHRGADATALIKASHVVLALG